MSRDEAYVQTCVHEAGHSLAAYLLTGECGAIELAGGGGLCHTKFPPDWPPNDHRFLVYDSLVTAAGLAAESLMLGHANRAKGRKDLQDLDATCAELTSLPLYQVQVSTLVDLMELASTALLAPHTQVVSVLADAIYAKGALPANDVYYRVVASFPQYAEAIYIPLLKGTDWLKGWDRLLAAAERRPDPLADWRGQAAIEAKAQKLRARIQARHRA